MIYLFYSVLIIIMIGLDQISKAVIVSKFELGQSINIIKDFFSITYVQNYGAGFSIMQNQTMILCLFTVLVITLLIYMLINTKKNEILYKTSYLLIIGGALGNFIDRISKVYVVDFLDFTFFGWGFPVFNVADCFVTIGTCLLIIASILENKNAKN